MRGPVIFDVDAGVAVDYRHPRTGLPFGRGFIIDQNGIVDTPYFGHRPGQAIKRIYELLDSAGVVPGGPGASTRIALERRGPNPFSTSTTLRYMLPERAEVEVLVFDVTGRLVSTLVREWADAGDHEVVWNRETDSGLPVASGVYFARLVVQGSGTKASDALKLVVLR